MNDRDKARQELNRELSGPMPDPGKLKRLVVEVDAPGIGVFDRWAESLIKQVRRVVNR